MAYVAAEVSRLLRDPEYVGAVFVIQTYVVGKENILLAVGRRDGEYSSTYWGAVRESLEYGLYLPVLLPPQLFWLVVLHGTDT